MARAKRVIREVAVESDASDVENVEPVAETVAEVKPKPKPKRVRTKKEPVVVPEPEPEPVPMVVDEQVEEEEDDEESVEEHKPVKPTKQKHELSAAKKV